MSIQLERSSLFLAALVASCSGPEAGVCDSNADCEAGSACLAGECRTLCGSQSECSTGEVCYEGVCQAPTGTQLPEILNVLGNDDTDPSGAHVLDGIVVIGSSLRDANFEMVGDAGSVFPSIRSQNDERVELALPVEVRSGDYLLVAVNSAGTDQESIQLQLPELTGELLIGRINSATSGAVDIARLPVGTDATAVSRGDHHHDMAYYPRADADATFLTQAEGDAMYVPLGSPLSPWQTTDNDITYDQGNVGVGDPAPQTALSVQGSATGFQLSGTVSSTGTTTIDGNGTAFSTELVVGESVIIGSQAYTVAAIANETTMTVSPAPAAGFLDEVAYRAGGLFRVADSSGAAMLDVDRQGNLHAAGNVTIGGTFCVSDPADSAVDVCLGATNAGEDSYIGRSIANDTCDGNNSAQYTCGVMEARICIDRYQTTAALTRTVTCKRAYMLRMP